MAKERSNRKRRAALAAEVNYAPLTAHFLMVLGGAGREPATGATEEGDTLTATLAALWRRRSIRGRRRR